MSWFRRWMHRIACDGFVHAHSDAECPDPYYPSFVATDGMILSDPGECQHGLPCPHEAHEKPTRYA